jgi:hypothetical protein
MLCRHPGGQLRSNSGFVIAPNGAALPLAGVSLVTFDGNGTYTSTGSASLNGTVSESTTTGTYRMKPDCTGDYTGQNSTGRTGTAYFVIADNGNEIHILPNGILVGGVVRNPGASLICIARKVFPVGNPKD